MADELDFLKLSFTFLLYFLIHCRYGDMRVTMGCEIFSMWQNLGKWLNTSPVTHKMKANY